LDPSAQELGNEEKERFSPALWIVLMKRFGIIPNFIQVVS